MNVSLSAGCGKIFKRWPVSGDKKVGGGRTRSCCVLPEGPEIGWTPRCMPVVARSLELYTDDSPILARFHPNLEGEHPGGGRGLPPLFPFHQPHERTCGSMAV
ncbi:hypothetical protein TNCV_362891 [Trichonephila clavipes]|nr:hypothetical protein TNCV_362891 [Trichonephila clavipes]